MDGGGGGVGGGEGGVGASKGQGRGRERPMKCCCKGTRGKDMRVDLCFTDGGFWQVC